MNPQEVEIIARRVIRSEINVSMALARITPKISTKQACEILECDRKWLYAHRNELDGRIKNKRGDFEFDTSKIVEYKIRMS